MAVTDEQGNPKKGRAGAYTFYQRNGQTIMRVASRRTDQKGRTGKSMAARTKMSNIVHAWRTMKVALKGCFERQRPGQTEYSVFLSANLENAQVCLSQEEAVGGTMVADRFYVSQGTLLPPVEATRGERVTRSDIRLDLGELTPETRADDVAESIVRLNKGAFRYGDVLLFVRLSQYIDCDRLHPAGDTYCARFTLNPDNHYPFLASLGGGKSMDGFRLEAGCLAAENRSNSLVAWVRLRPDGKGGTLATTQRLVGENELLERYTGWEQREQAIHSYGRLKGEPNLAPPSYEPYEEQQYPELGAPPRPAR